MGARRGGASVGRRPPPPLKKKVFWLYLGPFCYFFSYGGLGYVFLILGPFHYMHVGAFLLLFTLWWKAFLCLPPPPLTKIFAGAHDCKESSRACSTEIFLCDHNLVSSGHVLLRFCLKNDKNNDTL